MGRPPPREPRRTRNGDLVGVFGRGRGIVLRPRLPTDDGSRAPLGRTYGRQPFIAFERRLEEEGPRVARQGGQPDGLGRGSNADLRAFGRVRGLEHEGPRHRGERQVERHVDEDRQDEQPPVPHSQILTHVPALTASHSSGRVVRRPGASQGLQTASRVGSPRSPRGRFKSFLRSVSLPVRAPASGLMTLRCGNMPVCVTLRTRGDHAPTTHSRSQPPRPTLPANPGWTRLTDAPPYPPPSRSRYLDRVDTTLVFDGAVASGIGKHADLTCPGEATSVKLLRTGRSFCSRARSTFASSQTAIQRSSPIADSPTRFRPSTRTASRAASKSDMTNSVTTS